MTEEAPAAQRRPTPANGIPATALTATANEPTFVPVRPSDYLRPRAASRPVTPAKIHQPERPIDRDEREGLSAIRGFLKARKCYEITPLSFRLILLDTTLTVKASLQTLATNGIVSAPLWNSTTSTYAGLLTVTDYLNVVQYYNLHSEKLKDVDKLLLSDLREIERVLKVKPPETISTKPTTILYDALRAMLESRARRIPLLDKDEQSQRPYPVSVITQYRILKFIAINVGATDKLRKPLRSLQLGAYKDLVRCGMDTLVIDVVQAMVDKNISSVPVVSGEGVLLNVFEAVDIIEILKTSDYGRLTWEIADALALRSESYTGIYTCSPDDGLDTIFDTLRKSRVHRLMIVDEDNYLKGVLSLSDILNYILIDGNEEIAQ